MKRPRMTYRQFLAELRRMRLRWKYTSTKAIRAGGGGRAFSWGDRLMCPLVAVQVHRKIFDVRWGSAQAAKNLGLRESVAVKIIDMADGRRPLDPAFRRALRLP